MAKAVKVPAVKVGDTVLFVLPEGKQDAGDRAAIVVAVDAERAAEGAVSLIVFLDGRYDDYASPPALGQWRPFVVFDGSGEPGTWHPVEASTPVAPTPDPAIAQVQDDMAKLRADLTPAAAVPAPATPGESSAVAETATPPAGSGI